MIQPSDEKQCSHSHVHVNLGTGERPRCAWCGAAVDYSWSRLMGDEPREQASHNGATE